jgi:hypothetical protein|nr:MAG TPA: shock protein B [Caudoviricetes sp.]
MSNTNKGGNVNINIGDKEKQGYYVGSASNMARLFILISVVFGVLVGYIIAKESSDYNNLNRRVEVLERLAR